MTPETSTIPLRRAAASRAAARGAVHEPPPGGGAPVAWLAARPNSIGSRELLLGAKAAMTGAMVSAAEASMSPTLCAARTRRIPRMG